MTVGVQECQSVMYEPETIIRSILIDIILSNRISYLPWMFGLLWLKVQWAKGSSLCFANLIPDSFTLVASRAMGAIHICVFVRHDIIDCVSNVSTTYVPCGIGNVMYNKV